MVFAEVIEMDSFSLLVIVLGLTVFALLVVGAVLIVRDTMNGRGRWGINLKAAVCLKCQTPAPIGRKPANFNQALWGGWTCAQCGFELDKWGEPIAEQPFPAKWSARLDEPVPPAMPSDDRYHKPTDDYQQRGDIRG